MMEVYKICVGKMKIDPNYFLYDMSVNEMDEIIKSYNEDYINEWEKVRLLYNTILGAVGAKAPPLKFEWDKQEVESKISEEELRDRQEELLNIMKKRKQING